MTDVGRIARALTPSARRILFEPRPVAGMEDELRAISEIDRAHLVMLHQQGLAGVEAVCALLDEIDRLRAARFAPLADRTAPRGLYLMYESYLIEALGDAAGGMLHTGRSRNDLNATLLRMKLRAPYHALLGEALRLQAIVLRRAQRFAEVVMPAYTHYQPAVPITLGHYLLGVAQALGRDIAALVASADDLETCPLGAGAGGGTSLAIDPARTAALLGFARPVSHALDAVASRDLVLRLLSASAVLGVTLSRVAADLLLWTTGEFAFLELPDECVGSSSMMPQKRNPFLLEHVQGKSAAPLGALVAAATAMHAKPFTNSIAVGTDAVSHVWDALTQTCDAATLTRLVIARAQPAPDAMRRRAEQGYTSATELANRLVVSGAMPFRSAHRAVGALVREAVARGGEPLATAARRHWPDPRDAALAQDLDPSAVARATRHGGGPGDITAEIDRAVIAWSRQRRMLRIQRNGWRRAAIALERVTRNLRSTARRTPHVPAAIEADQHGNREA